MSRSDAAELLAVMCMTCMGGFAIAGMWVPVIAYFVAAVFWFIASWVTR